jgi:hypothetical protein
VTDWRASLAIAVAFFAKISPRKRKSVLPPSFLPRARRICAHEREFAPLRVHFIPSMRALAGAARLIAAHRSPPRGSAALTTHRLLRSSFSTPTRTQQQRYSSHPTAFVGGGAKIGEGVSIGPFCVVSDGATIGPHCELGASVHVLGSTVLGHSCVIRSHAVIGAEVRANAVDFFNVLSPALTLGVGTRGFRGTHARLHLQLRL